MQKKKPFVPQYGTEDLRVATQIAGSIRPLEAL